MSFEGVGSMSEVRLNDYEPPARDDLPWVKVVIEEGPTADGPWVEIDRQDLVPVDTDPENPAVRDFTTVNATLDGGWYRVYFLDANDDPSFPSASTSASLAITYLPSVRQVATHIRNRTRLGEPWNGMPEGAHAGTFAPTATNPTSSQARDTIREASNFVGSKLGRDVPTAVREMARSVVALRAAMQIELSYYSEQVATNRSHYPQLKELYDDAIEEAEEAATEEDPGPGAGGDTGYPSYGGFPDTAIGMETPW